MTSEEANKSLVEAFFQDYGNDPAAAVAKYLADGATWWVPPSLPMAGDRTKSELIEMLGSLRDKFVAGPTITVEAMTAEADRVAAEIRSDAELMNGRKYQNTGHFVFVVREGRFDRVKEYLDTLYVHQHFFAD